MSKKQVEYKGWVVVNVSGFIMEWTFSFSRSGAIESLVKESKWSWKQWYRKGVRCVKATKIISIDQP